MQFKTKSPPGSTPEPSDIASDIAGCFAIVPRRFGARGNRDLGQDPWNTLFSQDTFKVAKAGIGIDSALSKLQPLKPPSAAALKNMSQEVVEQKPGSGYETAM